MKTILLYPKTWIITLIISGMHTFYAFFFAPDIFFHILAAVIDLILLGVWIYMIFKDLSYNNVFLKLSYKKQVDELSKILVRCKDEFKRPARHCLDLAHSLAEELGDRQFEKQMSLTVTALFNLSEKENWYTNHHKSEKEFSTLAMIKEVLSVLQTLSGILTGVQNDEQRRDEALEMISQLNRNMGIFPEKYKGKINSI